MKKLEYGLIANRHNMPVQDFIFYEIKDPTEIKAIEEKAYERVKDILSKAGEIRSVKVNKDGYVRLDLYVTGLSVALIALIKACGKVHKENAVNIKLVLKHHNYKTKNYHNQIIFFYK